MKELSELFVQVVKLAREMGRVKLGTVAIDAAATGQIGRSNSNRRNTAPESDIPSSGRLGVMHNFQSE